MFGRLRNNWIETLLARVHAAMRREAVKAWKEKFSEIVADQKPLEPAPERPLNNKNAK